MSLNKRSIAVVPGPLLAAGPAHAHPGPHDASQPGGLLHWIIETDHGFYAVLAAGLALLASLVLFRMLVRAGKGKLGK